MEIVNTLYKMKVLKAWDYARTTFESETLRIAYIKAAPPNISFRNLEFRRLAIFMRCPRQIYFFEISNFARGGKRYAVYLMIIFIVFVGPGRPVSQN